MPTIEELLHFLDKTTLFDSSPLAYYLTAKGVLSAMRKKNDRLCNLSLVLNKYSVQVRCCYDDHIQLRKDEGLYCLDLR